MELNEAIQEIRKALEITGIKADDKTILECATKLYISSRISKDRAAAKPFIQEKQNNWTQGNDGPTPKQKSWLKAHGINVSPTMTKMEAIQVIKEAKESEDKKTSYY